MTNADRIRNMSDEELAKQITLFIENAFGFYLSSEACEKIDLSADETINLNWLKSEYKESWSL